MKESEERLAEAQKIAHIGSWECNPVTNKLYWSDEVYRIFELDPQEFEQIHDAFFKYVHPEDREYVNHAINSTSPTGSENHLSPLRFQTFNRKVF